MKYRLALTILFATVAGQAYAQVDSPRIDQRQLNQERRIDQGTASGSVTQREANRLERGQQRVERIEARAEADGVLTRREQARVHRAQDRQSQRIAMQKHDRQHDYNHNGRVDRPARR